MSTPRMHGTRRLIAAGALVLLAAAAPPVAAEEEPDPNDPTLPRIVAASGRFWPGDACLVRERGTCVRSREPLTVRRGDDVAFTNTDTVRHDVRSFATAPDGRSSFASDVIGPTRSSIVFGASELEPGLYRFYCTLHPAAPDGTGMSGLLRVAPAGVR